MKRIAALIGLAFFTLALGMSGAALAAGMPTTESVATWLKSYQAAWETRDADKAAKLFTADATYQEDPYQKPFLGQKGIHDYWAGVTKDQSNIKFTSEVLAVAGANGIAHWHAEFDRISNGKHCKLDGIFVLEFTKDGLVKSLREWWHYVEEDKAKP
jgi:ketosteroid isomerase-like protein